MFFEWDTSSSRSSNPSSDKSWYLWASTAAITTASPRPLLWPDWREFRFLTFLTFHPGFSRMCYVNQIAKSKKNVAFLSLFTAAIHLHFFSLHFYNRRKVLRQLKYLRIWFTFLMIISYKNTSFSHKNSLSIIFLNNHRKVNFYCLFRFN